VDICSILQHAVEVCRPELEARQLHYTTHFGDVTRLVDADAARLQQVFWNLIKNAIKFSPPNGCVGIRCRTQDDQVVIEVSDSGVGIAPEALPKIFDAFAQADVHITREFGGLGLGLSISKSLVQLHGGSIEAHSDGNDRGSTFIVRLPLHERVPEPVAPPVFARPAESAGGPQRLRILLAEDHEDTAEMVRLMLESEGHMVETASDVSSAIRMATGRAFDLLISDLGLPDGSGLDLMRDLRNSGRGLPGIALSGYGQERDIEKSHEAGFSAHLVKPIDIEQFLAAVKDVASEFVPARV
jgi:two-component system CheB/CheR fusion protein